MTDIATSTAPSGALSSRRTTDDIVIGIVGSGGDGVISSGELLVSAAAAEGLYAAILKSFGPQIRGGESSCRVRISREEALSYGDRLDVLVAFNWADFARFQEELELAPGVVVIYDSKDGTPAASSRSTRRSSPSSSRSPSTTSPTRRPARRSRRTSCSSA